MSSEIAGRQTAQQERGGFALLCFLVGLATGGAAYLIINYADGHHSYQTLLATLLVFLCAMSAAFLLLVEKEMILRVVPAALGIGAMLALPSYFMISAQDASPSLDIFPVAFWLAAGAPLSAYLMTSLAKASLDHGAPRYPALFFHGLTLPLILGGAKVFAGLALLLLFAWAMLLQALKVDFFFELFRKPWFLLPFLGAIGGLSIAMMRGLDAALGALRFVLLLFCRIAMPITAAFSLTFVVILLVNGTAAIFEQPYAAGIMLGLAFAGMLIFNGVYQNGEGGPPPLWLRLSSIAAIAVFPVYAILAAVAFWMRVSEYGLTPPRVIGLAMNVLAALYSIVCLAGLLTELNWRGKRWMPLVAPLNITMAAIWIVVLIALATPLADPWAISAKSQERLLLNGKIAAEKFDFDYLHSKLGRKGEEALARLAETPDSHPQAAVIRAGVAAALAPKTETQTTPEPTETVEPTDETPGVEDLPLNPSDESSADSAAPPS